MILPAIHWTLSVFNMSHITWLYPEDPNMAGLTALSDILNMLVSVYCLIMIWMDILLLLEQLIKDISPWH